jgi:hypothetical protein
MSEQHRAGPLIQPGVESDLPGLKKLMHIANNYSIAKSGLPQWVALDEAYRDLEDRLEHGECFLMRNVNGEPTASVSTNETSSDWGELGQDGSALYFLKLMKDPSQAPLDAGQQLLGFVGREAAQRGKEFVRCDAVDEPELQSLMDFYQRNTFKERSRFIYGSSGRPGILLEARTEDLLEHIEYLEHLEQD